MLSNEFKYYPKINSSLSKTEIKNITIGLNYYSEGCQRFFMKMYIYATEVQQNKSL